MKVVTILMVLFLATQAQAAELIVAEGALHGGNYAPKDTASGRVSLVKLDSGTYELRLNSNFNTTPGPDLFVYFSASEDPHDATSITNNAIFEAGKLGSPSGEQKLALPNSFDPTKFRSVAIWCKQYTILFGAAPLKKHQ